MNDEQLVPERRMSVTESPAARASEGLTYRIIGAAMKVHNELGPGLKEAIYQHALSLAMQEAGLSFEEEKHVQVAINETQVGLLYLDHFVEDTIVVEEKAFSHLLTDEEVAQVITYLAVMEAKVGLLLNFGRRKLEYKRILPPTKFEEWRNRAARYAWRPPEGPISNPLIRSLSADSHPPMDEVRT
jgi:GxxExxY protein